MSINFIAFVIGLFGVPIALLAYGHRIRKRSTRERNAFGGGIIGHCIAGALAVTFGMLPPESWTAAETTRGFLGLWSLLTFPIFGAVIGAFFPESEQQTTRASRSSPRR